MRAMILAAGRGERMRPLTDNCPKPLLKAGGKALIEWHLLALAKAGVRQVVINHAYLGQAIEAALGNGELYGVRIEYSPEETALETAGGIAKALPLLGAGPFLVVNGDVACDWDYSKALALAHNWPSGVLAHLVMVPNPQHNPNGDFAFAQPGARVGALVASGPTQHTFSGLGVYSHALFAEVAPGQPAKLAPLLRQAMEQGAVMGELHSGFWMDIGTPQRLAELDARYGHMKEV